MQSFENSRSRLRMPLHSLSILLPSNPTQYYRRLPPRSARDSDQPHPSKSSKHLLDWSDPPHLSLALRPNVGTPLDSHVKEQDPFEPIVSSKWTKRQQTRTCNTFRLELVDIANTPLPAPNRPGVPSEEQVGHPSIDPQVELLELISRFPPRPSPGLLRLQVCNRQPPILMIEHTNDGPSRLFLHLPRSGQKLGRIIAKCPLRMRNH